MSKLRDGAVLPGPHRPARPDRSLGPHEGAEGGSRASWTGPGGSWATVGEAVGTGGVGEAGRGALPGPGVYWGSEGRGVR